MIKVFTNRLANLRLQLSAPFSLPKHELLSMPALSPTMKEGKILKWLMKEGEKVQPGDSIAEIETDKATMPFEVQEKGYLAKVNHNSDFIALGSPVAIITKKASEVEQFANYNFDSAASNQQESAQPEQPVKVEKKEKVEPKKQAASQDASSYPAHTFLQMPAVSPTMQSGKILKWRIQPGDAFNVGDALFSIQTDKAVMDYQATEKGFLAKIIAKNDQALPVNQKVAIVVKKKDNIPAFANFKEGSQSADSQKVQQEKSSPAAKEEQVEVEKTSAPRDPNARVVASPLARTMAKQKNIDLTQIVGSGPDNRIIKQDIESYLSKGTLKKSQPKPAAESTPQQSSSKTPAPTEQKTPKKAPSQITPGVNPYQQIALNGMRKTIASRLVQSKQTIPHYYVSLSIEMDAIISLRAELNKNQKQNGTKISVNDIIIKAMALALRDYPDVNVQWHGTAIRKFKYSDISVAVAVQGGLITPIVHRAQSLGLLQISKKVKDLAKRAKEGKLDPKEYTGGTSTISNLGMFGINTVTSIINPPQATILGIGKTQKKVLPSLQGPDPYRVAEVMDIIASSDHRAVDGALTAQWLTRIKYYLEHPTQMLL